MRRIASEIEVDRAQGVLADEDHVFGRNLGSMRNLSGKRVLLIGCGTIGSFLAQQLVQCGCGVGSGSLMLVDSDILRPANLGRHLLGVPYLHRNKAEACAEFLREQLPLVSVVGRGNAVTAGQFPIARYDLVIDATGEEAFSIALNERAVRTRPDSPPILFVWLLGNGAAARCILTGSSGRACFKCLKPQLSGPQRYQALRPGADVEIINNHGCGDTTYVPFPVSRSVAAAALGCDLVLDWANEKPGDHFRSLVFDEKRAFHNKNGSPGPSETCPACGTERVT